MKKQLIIAFLVLIAIGAKSQTLYTGMEHYLNSANTYASDGIYTKVNSQGFLNASYIPVISPTNSNLFINKTDVDRLFNGTPSEFKASYQLSTGGTACNASLNQELNCYGISIRETFVSSGTSPLVPTNIWYVKVSAFDSGCLFAGLQSNGGVSTSNFYTFPSGANSPTKPLITESASNPGHFYICGSYILSGITFMYAMEIDAAGTQVWTKIYDLGNGSISRLEPRAIIESPYSGTELAVVGLAANSTARVEDGFFMLLDYSNNGQVISLTTYGTGTSATMDYFSSIAIANSTTGGSNGYIIGGYTNQNLTSGRAWFLKVDPTGAIVWNYRYKPSQEITAGDIVGVIERFSSTYSQHEYYGTCASPRGTLVLKIDDAGAPHNVATNPENEFYFLSDPLWFTVSYPVSITYEDNGGVNDGLHVHGGDDVTTPTEFHLTAACFNGIGGLSCSGSYINTYNVMNSSYYFAGPSSIGSPAYNINSGLTSCQYYSFSSFGNSCTSNGYCLPLTTIPAAGNQSKVLGINKDDAFDSQSYESFLLPNPATSHETIILKSSIGKHPQVIITDMLGKELIQFSELQTNASFDYTIDLKGLKLNEGIYFINIKSDKTQLSTKLLIKN